jgi:LmbE family N-acetylglucosaminyl deacetylase
MRRKTMIGVTALGAMAVGLWLRGAVPSAGLGVPQAVALPSPAPVPLRAPTALALAANARVIVFAPHPDDETIGVGGLIRRLTERRVPVRVVFVTNGDGFPRAVQQDFDVTQPTEADFVAFGELRQGEAMDALAHLGVERHDVRFLGFPDGGLAELWRSHWLPTHPYTSPYTKEASPPDLDHVGYDGKDLTSVIGRELRRFRPTVIVMPHPYDVHLDHAHTSYFVTEAASDLRASGVLPERLTFLTYLVHYPSWPARRPPGFDREVPLRDLPDTVWTEAELTPGELAAKRAALAEYRSQLEVMDGFLRNFLCRNELFGTVDGQILDRIARVH